MEKLKKIFRQLRAAYKAWKERRAARPKSKWAHIVRKSLWAVLLTGILTGFFVVLAFAWYSFVYLDDEFDLSMVDSTLNYTSVVYAMKNGKPVEVETLHTSEDRIWVDIDEIPENLKGAFIAIEDKRFYKHSGVDLLRTGSAVLNFLNFSSSSTYGGSTITQQVIKNLTGDSEQTISRKIQEIRRAWYLEREYKKDQILEVYLNTIYLSQGCYGVETAAQTYFDKSVQELTLLECACIAGITKYPTYYDPIQNPENNLERAHTVIRAMRDQGKITEEEANAALEAELKLHSGNGKSGTANSSEVHSYFVDAVINDAISALVNEKGYSRTYANSLLFSGGLQIYSTMDVDVQAAVDKYYTDPSNFPRVKSDKHKESLQSAIVVIDNSTGAIAGMAGGVGKKTVPRGLNRAIDTYRQPGSCMKPIGTYGPAIEYGVKIDGVKIAPGLLVLDKGVRQTASGNWWPKNYDSVSEKMMSIQTALDRSVNTVAVRVNNALGARTAFNFLKNNLGITSLVAGSGADENDQATALGGLTNGISVKEITAAYAAFPNGGTYTKPYTFTKICDQNGRVLLENRVESGKAMQKNTAALINQMLQHAATYGTGSVGNFGTTAVAGKTGTTSDDKDRWFVGYSRYYTAGVWVGYDQPETIYYSGRNPAAVAFRNVMGPIHSGLAYKSFEAATGLVNVEVCAETGKLPGEKCETKVTGQFMADSQPTAVCEECAKKYLEEHPEEVKKPDLNPSPVEPVTPDPPVDPTPVEPTDPEPTDPDPGEETDPPPEENTSE